MGPAAGAYEIGKAMRIVQMSDIHVGTEMFRPDLLEAVIQETNAYEPDLVAVVGDLTTSGHRREFEVDMVLCGHRHVPYLWSISGVRVVHSGTVSSERTRAGSCHPPTT